VSELQEVAGRARATPQQTLTACLAGLRPEVKTFCLSHKLQDVQDLLRWANVFEMCAGTPQPDTASTIERLEKALDRLQVRAASPAPRSPTRQVRFASPGRRSDEDGRQSVPRESRRDDAVRTSAQPWGNTGFGNRGGWRGRGMPARRAFGPRYGQNRDSGFSSDAAYHQFNQQPPRFGRGQRPSFFYSGGRQPQSCRNCGRAHDWGACPARESVCRACNKRGHWAAVCQSSSM
jgi:hypothetical protein